MLLILNSKVLYVHNIIKPYIFLPPPAPTLFPSYRNRRHNMRNAKLFIV